MTTITIPKNLIRNDDIVIIPRREYERMRTQMIPTFYLKGRKAKKLDSRVKESVEEYRKGKTSTLDFFLKKEYPHLCKTYGC